MIEVVLGYNILRVVNIFFSKSFITIHIKVPHYFKELSPTKNGTEVLVFSFVSSMLSVSFIKVAMKLAKQLLVLFQLEDLYFAEMRWKNGQLVGFYLVMP